MIRTALIAWILLEIAAFALAGQLLGVLGTLGLVLLTGLLGGLLLRAQGAAALAGLRSGVRRGGDPMQVLLRDGFRLVAALLLILPGLIGDLAGLLLLVPWVQRSVAADLARRGMRPANLGARPRGWPGPAASGPAATSGPVRRGPGRADVIEADWVELDAPGRGEPGPAAHDGNGPAGPRAAPRQPSGWTRP